MGSRDLVRLLVLWRLAGEWWRAEALYLYFCGGLSPAEIERKMGIRRTVVAGIVRRAYEVYGKNYGVDRVVSRCFAHVSRLETAFSSYCKLCGKSGFAKPMRHLALSHRKYVEQCVDVVVSSLRRVREDSVL